MLPPAAVSNLDAWLLTEYETRNDLLARQVMHVQTDFTRHGALHSSAFLVSVVELASNELPIRAEITTQRLLKTADDCGVTIDDRFRSYARAEIDRRVRNIIAPELKSRVSALPTFRMTTGASARLLDRIDLIADRTVRRLLSELDFLIMRNSRPAEAGGASMTGNTFNVAGNVGVIQVGSGNSASPHSISNNQQ